MTTFKTHYYCVKCIKYLLHDNAVIKNKLPYCPKCNNRLRTSPRHPKKEDMILWETSTREKSD